MMNQYLYKITPYLFSIALISCVPLSKFEEMKKNSENCTQENARIKSEMEILTVANTELISQNNKLFSEIAHKMNLDTNSELTRYAIQHGIIK